MDIEQLKLILEAAQAAGDGAMRVVIIWFFFKFVKLGLIVGLLFYTVKNVFGLITRAEASESFAQKVRFALGTTSDYYDPKILQWIRARNREDPLRP